MRKQLFRANGKRRNFLLLFLLVLVCSSLVLFQRYLTSTYRPSPSFVGKRTNSLASSPVIFLLDRETNSLFKNSTWKKKKMCPTPKELGVLAMHLCSAAGSRSSSCEKALPCSLLHSSNLQSLHCLPGGFLPSTRTNSSDQFQCRISRALDAFASNQSFPHLLANRYTLSKKFFIATLSRSFRSPSSVWAFAFSHESIRYYPWAGDSALLSLFNLTMGYHRKLYNLLVPVYLPPYLKKLTTDRTSISEVLREKTNVSSSYVRSSILYINSNCNPPSGRGAFMKELMKWINVDAWGRCHRNRPPAELPKEITKLHRISWDSTHYYGDWKASKMAMCKSYLFTIAIENSLSFDYVTEKLWQPLAAGSVPIYWGAPNIEDWLPCEHCIIDLRRFSQPKDVARLLADLSANRTKYAEYHQWRERPLPDRFLRLLQYFEWTKSRSLECLLCDLAHSKNVTDRRQQLLDQIGLV